MSTPRRPSAPRWHALGRSALRIAVVLAGVACASLLAVAWVARGPWVLKAPRVATAEASATRLRATVEHLTTACHPRSYKHPENLARAEAWVADGLRAAGLEPSVQEYRVHEGTFRNVVARREGTEPAAGVVVVGAHHDAYMTTPGADDNASGVAALVELARVTAGSRHRRTHVFVTFGTEEPPFFGTDDMGSYRFATSLVERGEAVALMISVEMVGTFSDAPGSQTHPFPFMDLVYPTRGDFIGVVGDMGSGSAIALVKRGLTSAGVLPVVSFRAPRSWGWVDMSDHHAFWRHDIPAVMVTDTGPMRNARYHGRGDTADTLDYRRMALVVRALQGVLVVADEA